jgi:predicted kinase
MAVDDTRLLVLMVGVPGAGKTWLLERLLPDHALVIRPDDHIGYTKKDPWTPRAAKAAWQRAHADLKEALRPEGPQVIVFDATMVSAHKRQKYIKMARKASVSPVAVYVDTPPLVCRARNDARDPARRVPDNAVAGMFGRLERPGPEEGFSAVVIYSGGTEFTLESLYEMDPYNDVINEINRWISDFKKDHNPETGEE